MPKSKGLVRKSNDLIYAGYSLSLPEHLLLLCCISKIKDPRQSVPDVVEITAREYSNMTGMPISRSYRALSDAAHSLYERSVKILNNNFNTDQEFRWLQGRGVYKKGEGSVELYWSEPIKKYLSSLKSRYTEYELRHAVKLKLNGFRLYEIVANKLDLGLSEFEMPIKNLRAILSLEDKYPAFPDFRRYILEPACKEISDNTNVTVSFEKVATKTRSVKDVRFKFERKSGSSKSQKKQPPKQKELEGDKPLTDEEREQQAETQRQISKLKDLLK